MTDNNKCDESKEGCTGDPKNCEIDPSECGQRQTKNKAPTATDMEDCLSRSLDTLSTAFKASAKRWESIVYPSLFAFILLAAYGFYLIYNLTSDVSKVAHHMESIATNMGSVSQNMVLLTQTVDSQSSSMKEMTVHMRHMSMSMGQMRYDLSVMNNSVSRPMQFMNTFMPW